jgi:predicted transcriptional regulator
MNGRMNFVLPRELAEPVAEIARRRMMSRSAYLRQALLEKLERLLPHSTMRGLTLHITR